jgi:hypothetical protein
VCGTLYEFEPGYDLSTCAVRGLHTPTGYAKHVTGVVGRKPYLRGLFHSHSRCKTLTMKEMLQQDRRGYTVFTAPDPLRSLSNMGGGGINFKLGVTCRRKF